MHIAPKQGDCGTAAQSNPTPPEAGEFMTGMLRYLYLDQPTPILENHDATTAPNYAFERQHVPIEDGLLSKDQAF
ncbi:S ribonuclease [Pyrus ussuriensis x Pyrus communis]|uniref:S ribonuclease n=1 Tax=Pyrus ussuriensis x Pyrus communis TaxID=2448454 RepID=A0A5N5H263_9ROSA|nr:S ribonuclease [Pyrus ussuriensis x Pyrus communis]